MNDLLTKMFGTSYRTTLTGWAGGGLIAMGVALQAGDYTHLGQGFQVVGALVLGYQGQISKDKTVTNALIPGPAQIVPSIVAAPSPVSLAMAQKSVAAKPVVNNP